MGRLWWCVWWWSLVWGDVTSSLVNPVQDSNPQPREWPCPDETDFLPCTCTSNQNTDLKIDCSAVTSNIELTRAFSVIFPFTDFVELRIVQDPYDPDYNLNALDPFVFAGLSFKAVIIQGTKLSEVQDSVFEDSQHFLTYLNLAKNELYSFPFDTLELYTKLSSLVLDDNNLPELPDLFSPTLLSLSINGNVNLYFSSDVFKNAPRLQTISLARNNLDTLPPHVFHPLDNITIINLEGNGLTFLEEATFDSPRDTVTQIILDNNMIDSIDNTSVQGLTPDALVSLVGNDVSELNETNWRVLFDQVPSGTIDLSENPLVCGCDMDWLFLAPYDTYRGVLTNTTTCTDGSQVRYLDESFFITECASDSSDYLFYD
ncbi:oplophorus-luciferin 2-monooxygenase non-catalytic subunit [Procambarus clarkii]|uniref:oplophorus-luciferin 2-monooxygenase non-catalytic subunit n=1 Tax=Procambarus clarkii TaxID=6728 RepID=UPI0037441992